MHREAGGACPIFTATKINENHYKGLLCLGGRSHEAYSSSSVCHYASVGGATGHTVVVLCVSVYLSVCRQDFSSLAKN